MFITSLRHLLRPLHSRAQLTSLFSCRNLVTDNQKSNPESETQPNKDESHQEELKKLSDEKNKAIELLEKIKNEVKILNNLRMESLQEVSRVRSRADREIEDAKKFGASTLAKDLLDVADVLDRAISVIPSSLVKEAAVQNDNSYAKEFHNLYEGVLMTKNILAKCFSKNGITRIDPMIGDPFNPSEHSAKFEIEGGPPPKTVGELFRPGYSIRGRVIRPAEVGVIQYE